MNMPPTHPPKWASQRGSAMLAAVTLTMILAGAATIYLFASHGSLEGSKREEDASLARIAAEEGVHRAIAEIKSNQDPGGDGIGTLTFEGTGERTIETSVIDLGGGFFNLHAMGSLRRASKSIDTIVEVVEGDPLTLNARAAVAARGPVSTTGNISIDGRDWNHLGTFIRGPGVHGVSSTQGITRKGSSTIGGNGLPPTTLVTPLVMEQFANWGDGVDDDGDGMIDEEAFDGIDNDSDGLIDEDINSYPSDPDVAFGLAPGTLKSIAQAAGTYFSSQAAIDAYIAANGGNLPGGKIIYAEFPTWLPVNLGNQLNADPSVIIHHIPSGMAVAKNLHGSVKGMFIADFVEHINGDFNLVGALMSFAPDAMGNSYGNGNALVRYSSEVLAMLPSSSPTIRVRIHSQNYSSNHQ